jgi:PilZ domain
MDEPTLVRPAGASEADVTLVPRGITVTARVDVSTQDTLVVRPRGDGTDSITAATPGDPVEVFWVGSDGELTLPARIALVDEGDQPRWHLVPTGPTERSQRRRAVRGRVELPVAIPWAGAQLLGWTVDISEAGMRALMDPWGLPPEAGTRLAATVDLGQASVDLHGEIVWQNSRGLQWLLAMRFDDVSEGDGDLLRRRVFQALREERAAAM